MTEPQAPGTLDPRHLRMQEALRQTEARLKVADKVCRLLSQYRLSLAFTPELVDDAFGELKEAHDAYEGLIEPPPTAAGRKRTSRSTCPVAPSATATATGGSPAPARCS